VNQIANLLFAAAIFSVSKARDVEIAVIANRYEKRNLWLQYWFYDLVFFSSEFRFRGIIGMYGTRRWSTR
jgi:hypothetical protein